MIYDLTGWRSEIRVSREPALIQRFGGRLEGSPLIANLPPVLEFKTPGTDPLPPRRTAAEYYRTTAWLEHLQVENRVIENGASTLDTLFEAGGGSLYPPERNAHNVVMTRYHGPSVPQGFVFTGFDVWNFKRAQCVQLVDFVLNDLWGLQREPSVTRPSRSVLPRPASRGGGAHATSRRGP